MASLLSIQNLSVDFISASIPTHALKNISLTVIIADNIDENIASVTNKRQQLLIGTGGYWSEVRGLAGNIKDQEASVILCKWI